MRIRVLVAAVIASALLVPVASAQVTRHVPAQHASIQAAIVASANGDTVLVAPGVYLERIDFLGKAITVRSSGGALATAIDANQTGTVVTFANGEGPASVLEGFTVRGGLGVSAIVGGIECQGTSPTIRACTITGNRGSAGSPTGFASGGVGGIYATATALRLIDCEVSGNFGGDGTSNAILSGNGGVGGIQITTAPGFGTPVFERVRVIGNRGGVGGNGIASPFGSGHGGCGGFQMFGLGGTVVLRQCELRGNDGGAGGVGNGGAGALTITGDTSIVVTWIGFTNCVITNNRGGAGGSSATSVGGSGGGVFTSGNIAILGLHTTIAGNDAGLPVAAGQVTGGFVVGGSVFASSNLSNCILWGNTRAGAPSDLLVVGIAVVANTCVIGASSSPVNGTGNLSVDPQFVNLATGDVHLTAASPCRHAGSAGAALVPFDFEGDPRVVGPAPDIGADEFDLLPGTREDFTLALTINGVADPAVTPVAGPAGALASKSLRSPQGTLANDFTVLLLEVWTPPVPPLPSAAYPGLQLPVTAPWFVVLPSGVGAAGSNIANIANVVPPGLSGMVVRLQGVVVSLAAKNGSYATTAARDVIL